MGGKGGCQESGAINRKAANTSCDNLGRGFRGRRISLLNGGSRAINARPQRGGEREKAVWFFYGFADSTVAGKGGAEAVASRDERRGFGGDFTGACDFTSPVTQQVVEKSLTRMFASPASQNKRVL